MAHRFIFGKPLIFRLQNVPLPASINADLGSKSMFFNECFDCSRVALYDKPNISKSELSYLFSHSLYSTFNFTEIILRAENIQSS